MGGLVGGLASSVLGGGGLLGGLVSNVMGSAGGLISGLAEKFGLGDVVQGAMNLGGDLLKSGLGSLIDNSPLPDFLKDIAKDTVGSVIGGFQKEVSCECQEAVNEGLGSDIEAEVDSIMDMVMQNMEEENGEASSGSGERASGSGGNWLMVLAKALGKAAGTHLDTMLEKGQEMGDMESSKGKEGEFAEVQAEFQAASQMFKMFQESISTMLKSLGEGMSSVARKQ